MIVLDHNCMTDPAMFDCRVNSVDKLDSVLIDVRDANVIID